MGAINADIDVAASIEYDKVSAKTYKRNHPNAIVINDDIRKIDIASLKIQGAKPENIRFTINETDILVQAETKGVPKLDWH